MLPLLWNYSAAARAVCGVGEGAQQGGASLHAVWLIRADATEAGPPVACAACLRVTLVRPRTTAVAAAVARRAAPTLRRRVCACC